MKTLGVYACLLALTWPFGAASQEPMTGLALELNAAQTGTNGCLLTFVVTNGFGADLNQVVLETVLFDVDGQVAQLTLFDFGAIPVARPRVRQFEVAEQSCENLGRVLINGANACSGDGLADTACIDGLSLQSRTDIEVVG